MPQLFGDNSFKMKNFTTSFLRSVAGVALRFLEILPRLGVNLVSFGFRLFSLSVAAP